jgi:hypothetical protein
MSVNESYSELMEQDYGKLIDGLSVDDLEKHYLRARWLEQVLWLEEKSGAAQRRYYGLRLTTVVAGVIVPALVGLRGITGTASNAVNWLAFGVSLLVAISAAIEGFFRYGERWRHYRRTAEQMKSEGWSLFQLSGPYRRHGSHAEAFQVFAGRVEDILGRDVEVYITEVVKEKKLEDDE